MQNSKGKMQKYGIPLSGMIIRRDDTQSSSLSLRAEGRAYNYFEFLALNF